MIASAEHLAIVITTDRVGWQQYRPFTDLIRERVGSPNYFTVDPDSSLLECLGSKTGHSREETQRRIVSLREPQGRRAPTKVGGAISGGIGCQDPPHRTCADLSRPGEFGVADSRAMQRSGLPAPRAAAVAGRPSRFPSARA